MKGHIHTLLILSRDKSLKLSPRSPAFLVSNLQVIAKHAPYTGGNTCKMEGSILFPTSRVNVGSFKNSSC